MSWRVTGYIRTETSLRCSLDLQFESSDEHGVSTYPLPNDLAEALREYLDVTAPVSVVKKVYDLIDPVVGEGSTDDRVRITRRTKRWWRRFWRLLRRG